MSKNLSVVLLLTKHTISIRNHLPPACLCPAFTAELLICFLPPQRSSYSPNQVHPWNNLIEKIRSKQASAIKFHQAIFLLYFIETAGELDQLLTKEKHIKTV